MVTLIGNDHSVVSHKRLYAGICQSRIEDSNVNDSMQIILTSIQNANEGIRLVSSLCFPHFRLRFIYGKEMLACILPLLQQRPGMNQYQCIHFPSSNHADGGYGFAERSSRSKDAVIISKHLLNGVFLLRSQLTNELHVYFATWICLILFIPCRKIALNQINHGILTAPRQA